MLRRGFRVVVLLALTACGEDSPSTGNGAGGSGAGSSGSAGTAGTAGGGGAGGTSTGGVGGSAQGGGSSGGAGTSGQGGTGGGPDNIAMAAEEECIDVCTLVSSACPGASFENCRGGCLAVIASGTCVQELYEASACVNRDLSAADVQCGPGSPTVVGCTEEQNRYADCTGQ